MHKLSSVVILLLSISFCLSVNLRQDTTTTINSDFMEKFISQLDAKLSNVTMSDQIGQLENKLNTLIGDMSVFNQSIVALQTADEVLQQRFDTMKSKLVEPSLPKQDLTEAKQLRLAEAHVNEPVEAQEVVQDPNAKVQIDGDLDFKFNVPITKYTSETSQIEMKGPKPQPLPAPQAKQQTQAQPQQQQAQVPQLQRPQQQLPPRQVIQQQQMAQQYRPQPMNIMQQQQMAAQQQYGINMQNQYLPYPQVEGGYMPQYPQQQYAMNTPQYYQSPQQQQWIQNTPQFVEAPKKLKGAKEAQKPAPVNLKKTQWVGSDEYVIKAKADRDLINLTNKELQNGAGNNMAYHYPRAGDIHTKTAQITSVNIDM